MTPAETGAYIFGCAGPELLPSEARFFAEAKPWGFILFARNVETPDQLRQLTDDLRSAVGWTAPVLIDQEGGRVQRLRGPHWREWYPPLDQMIRAGAHAARAMELRGRLIGHELRAVGIDVNCTPTLDLTQPETHPFLRNRTFGDAPEVVIAAGRATVAGQLAAGVLSVLKHIPGHGRAVNDSHFDLPRVTTSLAELRETDFAPFKALNNVALGMTAHVIYAALDPERPGTTSPIVQREIRTEIEFKGLLMTDDLSMEALPGSIADRTRDSLAAGCDLILHCNGDMVEMEQVVAHAQPLPECARARSDAALRLREAPTSLDIAATESDLETLLNGQVYDPDPAY